MEIFIEFNDRYEQGGAYHQLGSLHAELMRVGEDDHVLLLVIHVIAIDAYAAGLFLRELLIWYEGYVRDQEPSLPAAMRYSDYVLSEARCGERLSDAQVMAAPFSQ